VHRRLGLVDGRLELRQVGRVLHGQGHVRGRVAPPTGRVRLRLWSHRQIHATAGHARVVTHVVLESVAIRLAGFCQVTFDRILGRHFSIFQINNVSVC